MTHCSNVFEIDRAIPDTRRVRRNLGQGVENQTVVCSLLSHLSVAQRNLVLQRDADEVIDALHVLNPNNLAIRKSDWRGVVRMVDRDDDETVARELFHLDRVLCSLPISRWIEKD